MSSHKRPSLNRPPLARDSASSYYCDGDLPQSIAPDELRAVIRYVVVVVGETI